MFDRMAGHPLAKFAVMLVAIPIVLVAAFVESTWPLIVLLGLLLPAFMLEGRAMTLVERQSRSDALGMSVEIITRASGQRARVEAEQARVEAMDLYSQTVHRFGWDPLAELATQRAIASGPIPLALTAEEGSDGHRDSGA